jgi:hypothetical protein
MKRIVVELTRDQWSALLRAADNGAGCGDPNDECSLFPKFATRKAFRIAFSSINQAIGANYSTFEPENTPRAADT